jgi:hypothetical protein
MKTLKPPGILRALQRKKNAPKHLLKKTFANIQKTEYD